MFHHLHRAAIGQAFSTAEPAEYASLVAADETLTYILISAATAAITPDHPGNPDLGSACQQWLQHVAPEDRTPGWLHRFAGLLLAARARDTLPPALQRDIEQVRLRQAAYLLRTAIDNGPNRALSTLNVLRNSGMTKRSTPRAALADFNRRIKELKLP